jgi:hypothetical protein
MKTITKKSIFLIAALILAFSGCKKDNYNPIDDEIDYSITVYTNQTGNPDANALQAFIVNDRTPDVIALYGTFKSDGTPDKTLNVRHSKMGSDTVVNFLLDPISGKLHTSILEVGGQRSSILIKYEYPGPQNQTRISLYNYNWNNDSGELIYSAIYERNGENVQGMPDYILGGKTASDFIPTVVAALVVAKGVQLVGAAVVAAIGVKVLVATTVVAAIVVASMNNASAGDLTPQNTPYPENVVHENPIDQDEEYNLPPNPCLTSDLSVTIGIDPGDELVAIAQGGAGGPYNFYWSTNQTGSANTYHSIFAQEDGVYHVVVVDALGCAAYNSVYVGNMTVMQKLSQWGPWRSQNTTLTDDEIEGFVVFSFTGGLDCNCLNISYHEYIDIQEDIHVQFQSFNLCISEYQNDMKYAIDDDNCPPLDPANGEQLTIVSITPSSLLINDDGDIWNCTPF